MRRVAELLWHAEFPEGPGSHLSWLLRFEDSIPPACRHLWDAIAREMAPPQQWKQHRESSQHGSSRDVQVGTNSITDPKVGGIDLIAAATTSSFRVAGLRVTLLSPDGTPWKGIDPNSLSSLDPNSPQGPTRPRSISATETDCCFPISLRIPSFAPPATLEAAKEEKQRALASSLRQRCAEHKARAIAAAADSQQQLAIEAMQAITPRLSCDWGAPGPDEATLQEENEEEGLEVEMPPEKRARDLFSESLSRRILTARLGGRVCKDAHETGHFNLP